MSSTSLPTVAIAGATGYLGSHISAAFLSPSSRLLFSRIILLVRHSPSYPLPPPLPPSLPSDYAELRTYSESDLGACLEGADVLINAIGSGGADNHNFKDELARAAVAKGVRLYLPSEFGVDHTVHDVQHEEWTAKREHVESVLAAVRARRDELLGSAQSTVTDMKVCSVYCGLFLEDSISPLFGFNVENGGGDSANATTTTDATTETTTTDTTTTGTTKTDTTTDTGIITTTDSPSASTPPAIFESVGSPSAKVTFTSLQDLSRAVVSIAARASDPERLNDVPEALRLAGDVVSMLQIADLCRAEGVPVTVKTRDLGQYKEEATALTKTRPATYLRFLMGEEKIDHSSDTMGCDNGIFGQRWKSVADFVKETKGRPWARSRY